MTKYCELVAELSYKNYSLNIYCGHGLLRRVEYSCSYFFEWFFMSAAVEFTLEGKMIDSTKKENVLRVARRIQSIIYGNEFDRISPEIREGDSRVYFPDSNDFWLHPPSDTVFQKKDHWRLDSRYTSEDDLRLVVQVLKRFL